MLDSASVNSISSCGWGARESQQSERREAKRREAGGEAAGGGAESEAVAAAYHALASVPVEEGLAAEHRGELLGDALHDLLHAGGVAAEADGHLEALGGDVADGALEVVGDPLDEVGGVLVLRGRESGRARRQRLSRRERRREQRGGAEGCVDATMLTWTLSICSSTSLVDMRPRKRAHAVR
jgi:hypothetical protein